MNSPKPSADINGTQPALSLARETALTVAAAGLVTLFCASLLLVDRGFFFIDDTQIGTLPGFSEMNRAWRSGEVPLLSRCSWRSACIGGEYSSGVFSPSLTLSILLAFSLDLSLPLTAAVISIIHLTILAAGAFRLGRQRGLTVDLAMLVALIASLNGWIIFWAARNWGVCLFSFAWLPWAWWALERARDPRRGWTRFVLPGIFLYLVISAGWHFTVMMAGIVTGWLMLRSWVEHRTLQPLWPFVAAWIVGLGLSAPSWMMFLEFIANTARGQRGQVYFSDSWMVAPDSLPNLVFPHFISYSGVYYDSPHMGIELTGGLVPVVILLVALFRHGPGVFRNLRWECGLCAFLLFLCVSPSFGNFRISSRWLPLFFLALAMLAAQTIAAMRSATAANSVASSPNLGRWCFFLVLVVWCRAVMLAMGPMILLSGLGLAFLAIAYLWLKVEQHAGVDSTLRKWVPSAVVLTTCWLTYVVCEPFLEIAIWPIRETIRRPEPFDPSVRYMSLFTREDLWDNDPTRLVQPSKGIGEELIVGNTAMYSNLDFVTGYSPTGPAGMEQVLPFRMQGYASPEGIERLLSAETGPHGLLELLGVDGLVVADRFAEFRPVLVANGWREVDSVQDGMVFHRVGERSAHVRAVQVGQTIGDRNDILERITKRTEGSVPLLILGTPGSLGTADEHFAPVAIGSVEERRNSVAVELGTNAEGDGLLVFSRPWFPGYRATLDGKPLPVEVVDLMLPAVRIPQGAQGRLILEYMPRSLVIGAWCSLATGVFIVAVTALAFVQRPRRRVLDAESHGLQGHNENRALVSVASSA